MTIAAVSGQQGGTFADNATSVSRAFGSNIAAGSLVAVGGGKYTPSADAYVLGDCTKSAGTATLGTIQLDRQDGGDSDEDGGGFAGDYTAIWSAIATGGGSCTMQVAGAVAGSYLLIGTGEFSGNWDASRLESSNGSLSTANDLSAHGSGNATSVGAALFVGALAINFDSGMTITPDGAFTQIFEGEDAAHALGSFIYRIVGTGTTDSADWTFTTMGGGITTFGASATVVVYKEAAGGTTQDLAGAATGQAAATGAAAVSKPLAGTGAGQAAATAAASVEKPLAGGAAGQATATGQLITGAIVTPPLKNNTGTLLAGEAGATMHVYALGGALVVTKTGVATNGAGVMTVTDNAIITGTTYRVVIVLASGAEGMDKIVAT